MKRSGKPYNYIKTPARRTSLYGIMIALALILSYVESLIPAFFAVPGMKVGLTNIVVVFALFCLGERSALTINFIRILLVGCLFGNGVSLAYSLAGGLLSIIMMVLLKKSGKFGITTISTVGGVSHNVGQILMAMLLLGTGAIAWYLVILWFTGIASGFVIGVIGSLITGRLRKYFGDNI